MTADKTKVSLAFISVPNPEKTTGASHGKMHQVVVFLIKHGRPLTRQLFQLYQSLRVRETTIKPKGRPRIREYMHQDKVSKRGLKLWPLAYSKSGIKFSVYSGKREPTSRDIARENISGYVPANKPTYVGICHCEKAGEELPASGMHHLFEQLWYVSQHHAS